MAVNEKFLGFLDHFIDDRHRAINFAKALGADKFKKQGLNLESSVKNLQKEKNFIKMIKERYIDLEGGEKTTGKVLTFSNEQINE